MASDITKPANEAESTDESKLSKFNEGQLKTYRIHLLQKFIAESNTNLWIHNAEFAKYAYEIKFNLIITLFTECYPKLTKSKEGKKGEREEGLAVIKKIKQLIKDNPPFEIKIDVRTENRITHDLPNIANQEKIEHELLLFDLMVRDYLEAHDLGSPNVDESGL